MCLRELLIRTLFVTVLANFLIFVELFFSHRKFVYISRTLLPSCRLVRVDVFTSFPLPSNSVMTVGLIGPLEMVLERLGRVLELPFGVVRDDGVVDL